MNAGEHVINGKRVDPKKAKARSGKIFVGGLPQDTTEETIRSFFGTFGNVSLNPCRRIDSVILVMLI